VVADSTAVAALQAAAVDFMAVAVIQAAVFTVVETLAAATTAVAVIQVADSTAVETQDQFMVDPDQFTADQDPDQFMAAQARSMVDPDRFTVDPDRFMDQDPADFTVDQDMVVVANMTADPDILTQATAAGYMTHIQSMVACTHGQFGITHSLLVQSISGTGADLSS
jgi:hypothetical protein